MLNGIYHGNLGLDSDARQDDEGLFYGLAARRRWEWPWGARRLHVRARFGPDAAAYVVRDEGPGFDPHALPDPSDPARLERVGGRCLLLIRAFMEEVSFNARGNQLTLVKARQRRPPA